MPGNSLLQHLYADLTDQQIIYKVLHESDQLTHEAMAVAKEELAKRNINIEELRAAAEMEELQQKEYNNFKLTKTTGELIDLFKIISTAKGAGKTDAAIVHDFKKSGIEPGITISLIKEVKQQSKDKLDMIRADVFYGFLITVAGVGVAILANRFSGGTVMFLPYGAIFYGLFRLLKGVSDFALQKKLKLVIKGF
ncbi:hypothetical protein [Ferruginibacter profundus]